MATRIVLVQHAEKIAAPGDPGLTAAGHEQAATTAAWLDDLLGENVGAVVSSPLRRARDTAAPIAGRLGRSLGVDDRLVERMNWTEESGLDLPAFLDEWHRATDDRTYRPAIGQSSQATGDRMLAALVDLASAHLDDTVVAVTHGGATVDLLRTIEGDKGLEHCAPGLMADGPESCAVTVLVWTDDGWRVDQIADVSHLPRSPRWWIDEIRVAGAEHLDAAYVAGYERKAGFDPGPDVEILLGHGLGGGSTVVDLGAGTGVFACAAAAHAGRVVAADVSPAMTSAIRVKAEASGCTNVEVVQGGFLSYRHDGDPVDFVYSRNALHQLPDLWKAIALQRIHDLLRPGGILRLRDLVFDFEPGQADEHFAAWVDGAVGDLELGFTGPELEAHVRDEFSTWSWLLEPMLERVGFEILDADYVRAAYGAYTCRKL